MTKKMATTKSGRQVAQRKKQGVRRASCTSGIYEQAECDYWWWYPALQILSPFWYPSDKNDHGMMITFVVPLWSSEYWKPYRC